MDVANLILQDMDLQQQAPQWQRGSSRATMGTAEGEEAGFPHHLERKGGCTVARPRSRLTTRPDQVARQDWDSRWLGRAP